MEADHFLWKIGFARDAPANPGPQSYRQKNRMLVMIDPFWLGVLVTLAVEGAFFAITWLLLVAWFLAASEYDRG